MLAETIRPQPGWKRGVRVLGALLGITFSLFVGYAFMIIAWGGSSLSTGDLWMIWLMFGAALGAFVAALLLVPSVAREVPRLSFVPVAVYALIGLYFLGLALYAGLGFYVWPAALAGALAALAVWVRP